MIVVNLYYTGKNGSAREFVNEMESSGIAGKVRNERVISDTNTSFRKRTKKPCCLSINGRTSRQSTTIISRK